MKNLLIGLVVAVTTLQAAHANQFRANARVYMDRTQGVVEVFNHLPVPIVCSGRVDGQTMSGQVLYSFINNAVIYPGNFANAYVYTSNYDPFRRVMPRITCRTL